MSIRRFNGTSDELQCSVGGSNLTGAFTIAVLARPQAADEGTFISLWDATTERIAFGVNGSKQPKLKVGATAVSGAEIEVTPTTGQWGIWVVTKEAGTKNPRWHHYGYDTGVWKHANDGSTVGDPVTQAGGTVRFGNGTTLGFEQADLAAPAVWMSVLSDAEVEALKSAATLLGGWKPSAAGLWLFKQGVVTEKVTDATGNGANQSARTGTESLAEEPPIPYEGKASDVVPRRAHRGLVISGGRSV